MSLTAEDFENMKETLKSDIATMLRQIQINTANSNTLWDQQDIADYLRTTVKNLQNNKVFKRQDFPRAHVVPITDERPAKRWKATEVMAWAQKIRAVPDVKKAG